MIYSISLTYFLRNRTRNEHFAYLKQAAKYNFAAVAFNDGRLSKRRFTI
jgi:hypothetical protein